MIDDVITMFTLLMCNLQTRTQFWTKSRDKVDDDTNQIHLPKGIPSVSLNVILYQEVEKMEAPDFFHEKLGQ